MSTEDNYELKCQQTDDMNKITDKKNNVLVPENKTLIPSKKDQGFKQIQKILLMVFLLLIFTLIFGYLIYNYIIVKMFGADTGTNLKGGGGKRARW